MYKCVFCVLQAQRSESPEGASGTSRDIVLPKKKRRKAGISSFRAISTRIYRFFNVESDDQQSVFYNRSGHDVEVQRNLPEPPDRNGRDTRRSRPVHRGESTASRRPLLDGDSVGSSGPEMRSPIYNPLIKENENRQSGPYDDLTMAQRKSGQLLDHEAAVESPHDYFTLEKSKFNADHDGVDIVMPEMGNGHGHHGAVADTVDLEDEVDIMDTITEDDENVEPPKHDYFVLEPHEKERMASESASPSKGSVRSNQSSTRSTGSNSSGRYKPDVKPRVSLKNSPTRTGSAAPKIEEEIKTADNEDYVLSKLGDAPVPPPGVEPDIPDMDEEEEVDQDEYMTPKDVQKTPDYVDVLPNPPPRSSSLQPHEILHDPEHSPKKTNSLDGRNSSPTKAKSAKVTSNRSISPSKRSPVKSVSISPKGSPAKSVSSRKGSPTKTLSSSSSETSPVRSPSSPSSPMKSNSSPKGSPLKSPLSTKSSVTTDV